MQRDVHIIGGGLAGTEAALLLADSAVDVVLHEQKPERRSPAHKEDGLAELVCSNSLRSDNPHNAIGPIVAGDSVDRSIAFSQSRYGKGEGADYLNLPLARDQYERFVDELLRGQKVAPHAFEETRYFEGCLPIEVMAERGRDTLAFGPMKPVGLTDPHTGKRQIGRAHV